MRTGSPSGSVPRQSSMSLAISSGLRPVSIISSTATRMSVPLMASNWSRWPGQDPHHFRRQVLAGGFFLGSVWDVLRAEGEVVGQAVERLAGTGQADRSAPVEDQAGRTADGQPGVPADLSLVRQEGDAVAERGDVLAAQRADDVAVIGALEAQALRQPPDRVDLLLDHVRDTVPAAAREVVEGVPLDGLPQPGLA